MVRAPICLFAMGFLAACSANPDINAGVSAVAPTTVTANVQVSTDPAFKVPAGSEPLGEVLGSSCKLSIEMPEPTEAQALQKLQEAAAAKGANLVTGVAYITEGTSLVTNCWSMIMAKGEAYRAPPPQAPKTRQAR